jgi:hypothetical protein
VQGDAAFGNHPFDLAAGCYPGAGEQLGNALLSGIAVLLLKRHSVTPAARRRHWTLFRSLRGQGHFSGF